MTAAETETSHLGANATTFETSERALDIAVIEAAGGISSPQVGFQLVKAVLGHGLGILTDEGVSLLAKGLVAANLASCRAAVEKSRET